MFEIVKTEREYFANLFNQGSPEASNLISPNFEQNPTVITELFFPNSRITIKTKPTFFDEGYFHV